MSRLSPIVTPVRRRRQVDRWRHWLGTFLVLAGVGVAVAGTITVVPMAVVGAAIVLCGYALTHRWTTVRAAPTRLASEEPVRRRRDAA